MKRILLAALCLTLLCSGCVEHKVSVGKSAAAEKLSVNITSPKAGEILSGNKEVNFDAFVQGGKGPYTYSWSSSFDGNLSSSRSFMQNPSKLTKGHNYIFLTAKDANGNTGQGTVIIEVM